MSTAPVTWNLTDIYAGLDDPRIFTDLDTAEAHAEAFATRYRGLVGALTPESFSEAVRDYEAVQRNMALPGCFAYLLFAGEATNPAHGALLQKVEEREVAVSRHLLFFTLEIIAQPDEWFANVLTDPGVTPYAHWLQQIRAARLHRLSEPEEHILLEKSQTGRSAFVRLFEETISGMSFPVTLHGETTMFSEEEIRSMFYGPDRAVRAAAAEGLTKGLRERAHLFTFITNNLAQDKAVDDRLTHFDGPEAERHLNDEVETAAVHTMLDAVAAHFPTVARYYRLKREILGLETLTHYDRYAPVSEDVAAIPWEDARETVVDAYTRFAPEVGTMAQRFFSERWLDAEARPGKRGGAFCMGVAPDWHPYVLMNYLGKQRDVMTLAHELGHGIHDLLASGQSYLEYHPSLASAETASVFGEMLTFEAMLAREMTAKERLSLLTSKVEDVFATVFRQSVMYRYEQEVHTQRRASGELTTEQVSDIWQRNVQAMFGASLTLGEDHRLWWTYIPHFLHTPFYVYAYAFGQLMVMALYARYRQGGAAFVPHYLDLLRAGGSKRPADLMAIAGIDIEDRGFWEGGLAMIDELVTQAEEAWAACK
jgi:oligoendopeptidase F